MQHIYVDSASATGNVYVKCPDTSIAVSAVNALHGRWFAGKVGQEDDIADYTYIYPG